MVSKESIDAFFAQKNIAIAGVSRNKKKFGYAIYEALKERDYNLYPINPNATEIYGQKCYQSVSELPETVKSLLVVTPKSHTKQVMTEALDKNIPNIWIQQGSETPEILQLIGSAKNNIITKKCMFMFAQPVSGVHGFHRWMMKIFGKLPK